MIIQTSCSELLVDTAIHDPQIAYDRFSELFKKYGWGCSPPLSPELLERLKKDELNYHKAMDKDEEWPEPIEIMVFDRYGNRAWIQYGYNGYITTGFRFDSQCNHGDIDCFPIFEKVIKRLKGELIACDGGSKDCYEEWEKKK